MRISILGCGWLGLPLAVGLSTEGHAVRGSTTTAAKLGRLRTAGIHPHEIRLQPDPVGDLEGFFDADLLIVTVPPSGSDAYLAALAAAIGAARARGVGRFVYTSSTSVYASRGQVVDESDVVPPSSPRGRLMREAEALFLVPPIEAVILRLGGLFGEDREPARFLAGKRGIAGADAPVNLVHRDDVVAVAVEMVRRDIRTGIFNVVSDEHPPKSQFYAARARALGLEPPTFSDIAAPSKVVSNRKIKETIGHIFRPLPVV